MASVNVGVFSGSFPVFMVLGATGYVAGYIKNEHEGQYGGQKQKYHLDVHLKHLTGGGPVAEEPAAG